MASFLVVDEEDSEEPLRHVGLLVLAKSAEPSPEAVLDTVFSDNPSLKNDGDY